jgi:hypothetical protein
MCLDGPAMWVIAAAPSIISAALHMALHIGEVDHP